MKLTDEQQSMLDGAHGTLQAEHLRCLIEWGEAMGAQKLIRVESVMPNGLSVPNHNLGDVSDELVDRYIDYVRSCLKEGVRAKTTSHGACMDCSRAVLHKSDLRQVPVQDELLEMARQAGICLTWTCAPYLIGNVPVKGQICAWTESHAVIYINSILGARTTRHGNESAVAAAVTGWVPEFGVLCTENRRARFTIKVEVDLKDDTDWGCLGFFAGKIGGLRIPAFTGLKSPRLEAARQISAALATTGGAPMFHIAGVTPEPPTLDAALQGHREDETVSFGRQELEGVYENFNSGQDPAVDLVYFGCPHATLQEIVEIASALRGKKLNQNVNLVVSMSYAIEMQGRRLGFIQEIEAAGGSIMTDTCPTNTLWPQTRSMITPNVKTGFYARNIMGCDSILASLEDSIRAGLTGRWHQ